MSWKRKDWLQFAGLLGLGATGFGLAGIGPLAGLLGPTAAGTATGAAAGGELASVGATGSTMMGKSLPGLLGITPGGMSSFAKAMQLAQLAQGPQQQQQQAAPRPQVPVANSDALELIRRLYGGTA